MRPARLSLAILCAASLAALFQPAAAAAQAASRAPSAAQKAAGPRLDVTAAAGSAVPVESPVTIDSPAASPEEWFAKSDQRWLTVEPSRGVTPSRVLVRADPSGLAAGTYTAVLRFVDDAGDPMLVVPVTLTVGTPAAATAPAALASQPAAPAAPAAPPAAPAAVPPPSVGLAIALEALPPVTRNLPYLQTIPVKGGKPPYALRVTDGILPMGIILANGALKGQTRSTGVYPITIAVRDSSTPPQTAIKRLTLRVIIAYQDTALSVTHGNVTIAARAGQLTRGTRVGIASGTQALAWTAAADQPWLRVSPAQGMAPGFVQLDVDAKGLDPGAYVASVTITMEGVPNSPMRIPVQITVRK
jgi:hypothetical protein